MIKPLIVSLFYFCGVMVSLLYIDLNASALLKVCGLLFFSISSVILRHKFFRSNVLKHQFAVIPVSILLNVVFIWFTAAIFSTNNELLLMLEIYTIYLYWWTWSFFIFYGAIYEYRRDIKPIAFLFNIVVSTFAASIAIEGFIANFA